LEQVLPFLQILYIARKKNCSAASYVGVTPSDEGHYRKEDWHEVIVEA
jgi:hypothetical protein